MFRICASISITDSLEEGKSKFLAEVERLRESIRATEEGNQVLFLVDEILSGTNSKDRRIAAEAMIAALVEAGAVGALSTHDLALTEIAEKPELHGQNVHMESASREDPLAFDYRFFSLVLLRASPFLAQRTPGANADLIQASRSASPGGHTNGVVRWPYLLMTGVLFSSATINSATVIADTARPK